MLKLSLNPSDVRTYEQLKKSLDTQLRCLELEMKGSTATEGLSDAMYRAFVSVVDTFGQLLMTFKTNVTKFYEALKRSEIKAYSESNMMKVSTVERKRFDEVMHTSVDLPSGMDSTYMEAILAVDHLYGAMKLRQLIDIVKVELDKMYRSMSRGEDYSVSFNTMVKHFYDTKHDVSAALDVVNKCFTTKNTDKVTFDKAYSSMEEFRKVRVQLIDMEKYPQAVAGFVNDMEAMDKVLKNVTSFVAGNQDKLDATIVKSLAGFVRILSDYYEIYGMNVSRQMALEHNHILVIDNLYTDKAKSE